MKDLILDIGMEGGGERIFRELHGGECRFIRKYSYMQFDLDDWKGGEEPVNSFEEFWQKFTTDPRWYRYHPTFVHHDFRPPVFTALQHINLEALHDNEKGLVDEWVRVSSEGKYTNDSDFKNQCRWHQSFYRSEILKVWFDEDINVLLKEDGEKGLNFYDGFGIRDRVKKIPFRKPFHCNLLRSEHLPYNLFIPLDQNQDFCKQVFNDLLGSTIIDRIIHDIEIEFAPQPREQYLNDYTAFDTYIEYKHIDESIGILGIEVKYTEGSYPLKAGSTEHRRMTNEFNKSKYKEITQLSGKFQLNDGDFDQLKLDRYRQVWRNHVLGESILLKMDSKYRHFHSLTLYPAGNIHFTEALREYKEGLLKPEFQDCVRGVTYEDFFRSCRKYCPNHQYHKWIEYLEKRYLLQTKS